MEKQYESLCFYGSWWSVLKTLNDAERLEIFDAICKLAFDGDAAENLSPVSRGVFSFIQIQMEDAKAAYERKCERYRENARKRQAMATNGNQSLTMATNGEHKEKEKVEEEEKVEEKEDELLKSNSIKNIFSFFNINYAGTPAEKKEKDLIILSFYYLSKGVPNARLEAEEYYNYQEALGWEKTVQRKNGDEVRQKIQDRVAYGKGWKTKNEPCFSPRDGELFGSLLKTLHCCDAKFINEFRGFRNKDEEVSVLFQTIKTARAFRDYVDGSQYQQRAFRLLKTQFQNFRYLYYEANQLHC